MDGRVLNKVDPLVSQDAITAAQRDAEQRAAAIQREEDARAMRDAAVVAGYRRAPDRSLPEDFVMITDPEAPQVTPDVPPPPFAAVDLDETALRHYQAMGVTLSPSTEGKLAKLDEEDRLTASADRADADEAERAPSDAQTPQTTSSVQTAEPNQPNQPDQPSRPNEPNVPAGMSSGATVEDDPTAADTYDAMTVKTLRAEAKNRDIDVKSDAKKADIIAALEDHDGR